MKKVLLSSFVLILSIGLGACKKPGVLQKDELQSEVKIEKSVEKEEMYVDDEKDGEGISEETKKKEVVEEEGVVEDKKVEPAMVKQKTLLILDASGSMWGQIEGKTKISIAKDVVKSTVKKFESMELGLMAYGHRKKGDCKDIEILIEPKENNAKNISLMVDKINPKGMTPMGSSVLMAAKSLKYTEQKATVILVSDGIETCEVDLCALGKELEETGVDFTAHVIGFDMTEEQTAGLKCLANETGGTFTSAKNADDLGKALEKTVEASSCSKEKLGEVKLTVPIKVSANEKFDVGWDGSGKRRDAVGIFPKGSTNWNEHLNTFSYLDSKKGKGKLTAPTNNGEYEVLYFADCGTILGRELLNVGDVSASITIVETVSAGEEIEVSWVGPSNHNDAIGIFPKGSTNWNDHFKSFSYLDSKNGKWKITVPTEAGEYEMLYWLGEKKVLVRKSFRVVEVSASIKGVPFSVVKGTKFEISWVGPKNKSNAITILPKGATDWNKHVGGNLYNINNKISGTLTAPKNAGEYDVVFWLRHDKILDRKSFVVTN